MTTVSFAVQPPLDNEELNRLFAAAWPQHRQRDFMPVLQHSLTHIGAYSAQNLIGFVNVAWDGGAHAFLLDTTVHPNFRRRGIGSALVFAAIERARQNGVVWIHVDYESHLQSFYHACGFAPTNAGLINVARAE